MAKIEFVKSTSRLAAKFAQPASVVEEAELRKLEFAETLVELMKEKKISRKHLAEIMGVQPSRVTSLLSGENNFTIETMVKAARAVKATYHHVLVPDVNGSTWTMRGHAKLEEYIRNSIMEVQQPLAFEKVVHYGFTKEERMVAVLFSGESSLTENELDVAA